MGICGARKESAEEDEASTEVGIQRAIEKECVGLLTLLLKSTSLSDFSQVPTSKRPQPSYLLSTGFLLLYLKDMMCVCQLIHFFGFHHST